MQETINRLQHVKRVLLALVLVSIGVMLLIAGEGLNDHTSRWLRLLPLGELGGISIGVGLVSVWVDRYFQREADAASDAQLRTLLREHAPVMRDAVIEAFAGDTEDLKRVATPEMLDSLARNSISLRLSDPNFADEIYADIVDQAIDAPERWQDATVDITLTPHAQYDGYFTVTARWEYHVVPVHAQRRFICLSDRGEYTELVESDSDASVWYMRPNSEFDAKDQDAYELMAFTINGTDQRIRHATRHGFQAYTVNIPKALIDAGETVNVSYTTKTITRADGHLLFFDIEQPTRNIAVSLDYTDADLSVVSAIDLVPSVRPTRIEHSPEGVPPKTVRVEIDGWTFPRAGVAFIWTLNSETRSRNRTRKTVKSSSRGRS